MIMQKINTSIFLTYFFLICSKIFGQEFRIEGHTNKNSEIIKVKLFKYNSLFEQTLIGEIPVVNNFFQFKLELKEPDVFMLKNPLNSQFILFIWDDNVEFQIDNKNFWKSKIQNSKLSSEFKTINDSISLIGSKYRLLDSLLSEKKYIDKISQIEIDSLFSSKNYEYNKSLSEIKQLKEKYIQNNSNSFISLFFLTFTGFENTDSKRIQLFYCLSETLKKHTRAKIFLDSKY